MSWTRITDPEAAETLLPAWLGRRMVGLHGRFGLLLTTGDVLRIASITAVHHSPDGVILLDVLLDNAGLPDGIDLAWRPKQFLGTPVPGATAATVNLAQVVTAVEFMAAVPVSGRDEEEAQNADEVVTELARAAEAVAHGEDPMASPPERVAGALSAPTAAALPIELVDLPDLATAEPRGKRKKRPT
ncbi:MAG: hypothetical protein BGO51_27215 [Rhodospirillales bacterium 69-11]|nr:hypothetical protein [Rhodospirillales bacterium]MBN8926873.1 hypothetical protein [Rhodospirillales bacterium]OJW19070.1 MAG: hypothetical protein BGO51_27215 [Rhodospirillales bacterium 69-11]